MKTYEERMIVTPENLEDAKNELNARDQNNELEVGCEFWTIAYSGGCTGWMTIWPLSGRGAVEFGGDSVWGDWDSTKQLLYTDVYRDDGSAMVYDIYGEEAVAD